MHKPKSNLLACATLAGLLALGGCFYAPPSVISAQTTATLVGSMNTEPSGDEIRTAADQVDGRARFASIFRWGTPFPIEAGPHELTISVFRFSNGLAAEYGFNKLNVTLQPGHNYRICVVNPVPYVGPDHVASGWANDSKVWIADENGTPVSGKIDVFFKPPTTVVIIPMPVK